MNSGESGHASFQLGGKATQAPLDQIEIEIFSAFVLFAELRTLTRVVAPIVAEQLPVIRGKWRLETRLAKPFCAHLSLAVLTVKLCARKVKCV